MVTPFVFVYGTFGGGRRTVYVQLSTSLSDSQIRTLIDQRTVDLVGSTWLIVHMPQVVRLALMTRGHPTNARLATRRLTGLQVRL
jgi:hypothetical protein